VKVSSGNLGSHEVDVVVTSNREEQVGIAHARVSLDVDVDSVSLKKLYALELGCLAQPGAVFVDGVGRLDAAPSPRAGTGGAGAGLAYQILLAGMQLNVPRLFAALFLIAVSGVVLFGATVGLSRIALSRWHESETTPAG